MNHKALISMVAAAAMTGGCVYEKHCETDRHDGRDAVVACIDTCDGDAECIFDCFDDAACDGDCDDDVATSGEGIGGDGTGGGGGTDGDGSGGGDDAWGAVLAPCPGPRRARS